MDYCARLSTLEENQRFLNSESTYHSETLVRGRLVVERPAKKARVAIGTIRRMESFEGEIGARTSTLFRVQGTLEKAGMEFLNDDRPEVRVKGR